MKRSIFREVVLLCVAISLAALIVSFLVFGWTITFGLNREVGTAARAVAVRAASRFDVRRHEGLLRELSSPSQPAVTFAAFRKDLEARDPVRAGALAGVMNGLDDRTAPEEVVLVLDSAQQTAIDRLADDIGATKDGLGAGGIQSVSVNIIGAGGKLFLIDSTTRGYPFVSLDPYGEERNAAMQREVFRDGAARYTSWTYTDHYGRWISAWAPLAGKDGKTIAILEIDVKTGQLTLIQETLTFSTALGLSVASLLAFFFGLWWSRRFVRRIHSLTDAMRKVERGELDARLEESDDEIGSMARAFNAMTREIAGKDRMRMILEEAVSSEVAQALMKSSLAPAGEIREATVLFSDIRGYTAMSEEMDSLDVVSLLNDYFSVMAPIVEKYGGIVDKFIGDGMLAIFGAPGELPNDARSAVECALEMREAVREFNGRQRAEGRREIEIGIGINSGLLMAGTLGSRKRRNYTVLGRTVNIGARLCSKAPPGHILVSEATKDRAGADLVVSGPEPMLLKGITSPFVVYDVLRIG